MKQAVKTLIITVLMGLGHVRAAYPLKGLGDGEIMIYGSKRVTPQPEYKSWKKIRKAYYFLSRAGKVPLIGKYILGLMLALQSIRPYYPVKDQSKPNLALKYLLHLIQAKGLCSALIEKVRGKKINLVHTFYASAIALDKEGQGKNVQVPEDMKGVNNYLLITDTDFNRVWVPPDARSSRIKYMAPCTRVKKRLMSYGAREENIYLTGFPLPKENIGSKENLEILKKDIWERLLRLDPTDKFFAYHQKSVFHWLGKRAMPSQEKREKHFGLTFAVGGAGAQVEMIETILRSLKEKIALGEIKIQLSAGIQQLIFEKILGYINTLGMTQYLDKGISIIYDTDVYRYLDKFNQALRVTDVLWTKPSELSFYCGLGIPILIAPPIGTHEELNKRWLREIHAGLTPPGGLEYTHEWLFDLRENGRLAEAAWDGFLKAFTLGTYHIEELVTTGKYKLSRNPLEQ